jgi:cobalt-zinc-cadmium efflux system protein
VSGRHPHQRDGHSHPGLTTSADRRWLLAALGVIVCFMVAEVTGGLLAGSLALITDAGHMLIDATALAVAIVASRLAQRPAAGAYTYGFTRLDALSAQANGITLLLLACWFTVEAVRRLLQPSQVHGGPVLALALAGIAVNVLAVLLAGRANRASLNVRGAMAHLVTDVWAFLATAVAGLVILLTGWDRADAVASLLVAGLMVHSGLRLVAAAGRVFLEAAPAGTDPAVVGQAMAAVAGVREVHDLHVWDLGVGDAALSAHVVVEADFDCHEVAHGVRLVLAELHQISHATLQADHRHGDRELVGDDCAVRHGPGYVNKASDG